MTDEQAAEFVRQVGNKVIAESECMMCGKSIPATGWFWMGCAEEGPEFLCSEDCYEQHTRS